MTDDRPTTEHICLACRPASAEMGGGLITPVELAERWAVSVGHLANLRCYGGGPAFVRLGGSVRYAVADVVAWEQAARVESVA